MLLELALGVFSVKRANQWPISLKNSTQPSSNTAPLVSQPGTTAVRGGEGRGERGALISVLIQDRNHRCKIKKDLH